MKMHYILLIICSVQMMHSMQNQQKTLAQRVQDCRVKLTKIVQDSKEIKALEDSEQQKTMASEALTQLAGLDSEIAQLSYLVGLYDVLVKNRKMYSEKLDQAPQALDSLANRLALDAQSQEKFTSLNTCTEEQILAYSRRISEVQSTSLDAVQGLLLLVKPEKSCNIAQPYTLGCLQ